LADFNDVHFSLFYKLKALAPRHFWPIMWPIFQKAPRLAWLMSRARNTPGNTRTFANVTDWIACHVARSSRGALSFQ
jgi:hypothetical protein